ncbi:MAG: hypothetical protein HZB26_06485 [Candidatus Hydrogenedentes bacterium]|nr:hypothetical protein [Candidatus Hydrogenedentota bacterium]
MAEWTPEAGRRLQQYLERVAELSRARGDDADDITQQLRAHITTETESQSGAVVTLEHINRALALLGTPEQVVGVEAVSVIEPRAEQSAPSVRGYGKNTSIYVWILGVIIPAFSLGFELFTGVMSQMYKDPIPTWGHLAAGVALIGSIIYVDRTITGLRAGKPVSRWAFILNAYATLVGAIYFAIYLPILPIAVLAVAAFGLGIMGFSPLFVFAVSLGQMRILYRNLPALGIDTSWARRRSLTGAAIAAAILGVLNGPDLAGQTLLQMATSDNPQTRSRGTWWLETMHMENYVLDSCYHRVVTGIGPTRRWNDADIANWRACRELYFRLTGVPYNSVPKPKPVFGLSGRSTARNWQNQAITNSEIGGTEVAGQVDGLSLSSSTLDANASSAEDGTAGPAIAYIEWVVEFKNTSDVQREARGQIALPHGAVASRLTLWINGEEREAAFGTRGQVRAAYQEVAVVQRRDPALLSAVGPDTVLLQCFPVPAQGVMKVKVGISAPLTIRNGKAYLRPPYFEERNFGIPDDLEHHVWAESATATLTGSRSLTADANGGKHSAHGKLTNDQLSNLTSGVIELPAPNAMGITYADTLGSESASMTLRPYAASSSDPVSICLVIDGSASMNQLENSLDWREMVNALPANALVNAVFAGRDVEAWSRDFASPSPALAEWLTNREYRGGRDPVPALEKAWDMVSTKPHAVILWIHGPLPIDLSSIDGLNQWLQRRPASASGELIRLLEVSAVAGPNRVIEKCGDLAGIERVPVIGSLKDTLAYAAKSLHGEDVERVYTLAPDPAASNAGATAAAHVVRLAINQRVHEAVRRQNKKEQSELADLAVKARLVTPVSGAVVLEQQAQYTRHGLDPTRNEEAIPGIPEPEEWALMAIAACALVFMLVRRKTQRPASAHTAA